MARTKQTARKENYPTDFKKWASKETGQAWEDIPNEDREVLYNEYKKARPEKEKKRKREPLPQKKLPDTKLFDKFLEVRQIRKSAANAMNRAELIDDFNEWKISMAERRKTFPPGFLSWVTKEHQISRVEYIQMYTAEADKGFIQKFLETKREKEELVELKEKKAEIIKPTVPLVKVNVETNTALESWLTFGINTRRGTRGSNDYVVFTDQHGKQRKLYGPFF